MLDALPIAGQRDRARQTFATVVATGEPLHGHRDQVFAESWQQQRYETIILPLSTDSTTVDMLLVGLIHKRRKMTLSSHDQGAFQERHKERC